MRRSLLFLSILSLVLILAACASEPATAPADEAVTPAPDATADSVSGTWTGDWGPTETHRNNVSLDLKLDGTNVTGSVNPGPDAVALTSGSFSPDTGMIKMEADAPGAGGATVHFMIEGKVEGTTMSGTWMHDDKKGDFKLTKG